MIRFQLSGQVITGISGKQIILLIYSEMNIINGNMDIIFTGNIS
jgi:hypothetical protein